MLRFMVLGLLRYGERLHGYALWKAYERRSGQGIQNGTFYRVLKSLVESGLIRPSAEPGTDPRRMPYEITAAGSAAFDNWMLTLDVLDGFGEDPISTRAQFLFQMPHAVAQPFLVALADVLSARWRRIEYDRDRVRTRRGITDEERSIRSLLLTRNLDRTSADLTWLRQAGETYALLCGTTKSTAATGAPNRAKSRGALRNGR